MRFNSSEVLISSPKHYRQSSMIIAMVVFGHLFGIWCLFHWVKPYTFTTPTFSGAINVRFVSLSQQQLPVVIVQKQKPNFIQQQTQASESHIIQTEKSTKVIERKPQERNNQKLSNVQALKKIETETMEVTSSRPQESIQQATNETTSENIQNSSQGSQNQIEQNHAMTQGQLLTEQANKAVGQNLNQSNSLDQSVLEQQPIRVSNIDVLSFGAIKYDERILQHQERILILTLFVNQQGIPTKIVIKKSSGIDSLDQIVLKAAEKAKFKPYKLDGRAMPIVVDYPFQLKPKQNR